MGEAGERHGTKPTKPLQATAKIGPRQSGRSLGSPVPSRVPELVAGSESHDKVPSQPLIKSVYYAHAMCLYGHRVEHEELCVIRRGFRRGKIVNPADYSDHPEKLADTVDFCLRLVADSDAVVFSRLLGKVTAGERGV